MDAILKLTIMNDKKTCASKAKKATCPKTDKYEGVNIDRADTDKVTSKLVDQETRMLNNNPRNSD